jgi:hypothetical protein
MNSEKDFSLPFVFAEKLDLRYESYENILRTWEQQVDSFVFSLRDFRAVNKLCDSTSARNQALRVCVLHWRASFVCRILKIKEM